MRQRIINGIRLLVNMAPETHRQQVLKQYGVSVEEINETLKMVEIANSKRAYKERKRREENVSS